MRAKKSLREEQKPVLIPGSLHSQLKAIAQRRGMKLGAMVEFKLRELLVPEQLSLKSEGGK